MRDERRSRAGGAFRRQICLLDLSKIAGERTVSPRQIDLVREVTLSWIVLDRLAKIILGSPRPPESTMHLGMHKCLETRVCSENRWRDLEKR
jgi:hypothetical protein